MKSTTDRPSPELMPRAIRDAKMADQDCLPAKKVATRLGVSEKRVYALAKLGSLRVKKLGGAVYYTAKSVEDYERSTTPRPGLITIAEANKRYGYSRRTLFKFQKEGKIHGVKVKRNLHFDKAELDWALLGKGAPLTK